MRSGVQSSLKTIEKTLAEPVKSRFQISWPGQSGKAGCRTSEISGRALSQLATVSVDCSSWARRTPSVCEAAEGERAVVGRDVEAEQAVDFSDVLHGGFAVHRDGAEQQVAVAADVLGERLHADVDAVGEGVEEDAGGVGVVERDGDVAGVGGGDDRGHVLHFHRDRAGRLGPNERGVVADELGDVAADHRVVGFDFDVEVGQQAFGDFAAVAVGAFGHERVRARVAVGEIDERDGRHAAGDDERVPGVFELGDAGGQLERGGRAVDAVGRRPAGPPVVVGIGEVVEDDGRAAVDGRGERAETGRGFGGGVDERVRQWSGSAWLGDSFERSFMAFGLIRVVRVDSRESR